MKTPIRVLAVASGGGHWVELLRLRGAWDGCAVTYVTTDSGAREVLDAEGKSNGAAKPGFFSIVEANRWQKIRLARQLLQLFVIIAKVRPDVIVTTGAAPGYFALRIGRLLGARTAYIDSIANAEVLSLSGQKAGRVADLWLTQWEDLAQPGGPHYRGAVL
jgi:UDP-N-acetylglucosamine:LPS N-acetylglucosamine transferase